MASSAVMIVFFFIIVFFFLLLFYYHHSDLPFSVHHDFQWLVEADVADVLGFFHCRHLVEEVLTEDAVVVEGVDGEVADAEGGEVLEEVGSLAWVYPIVFQSRLHDEPCATDVRPFYRYSEPIVA